MIKLKSILFEQAINSKLVAAVKDWENNKAMKDGGWDPVKQRWYPFSSVEGGNPTIGFGHKLTSSDMSTNRFKNGLSDKEANALLLADLKSHEAIARRLVKSYDTLPTETQQALVNAVFRGELGTLKTPDTLRLMNAGKWSAAADEYLNYAEYKAAAPDSNIRRRMEWNAIRFSKVSKVKEPTKKKDTETKTVNTYIGSTLYPRKTSTHDYATVRTSPNVNNGLISNEQVKIYWPDPIGTVIGSDVINGVTWHNVKLPKDIGNGTGLGWVRFDVVTTDKNAKFQ
jgi:GH24 family phage-related lysozyme (muramidase)